MKKRRLACLAIFLLFFTAPLFAQGTGTASGDPGTAADQAQGEPHPAWGAGGDWDIHRMHHGHKAGIAHFLNLSKEQMVKSHEIWSRRFADTHNLRYGLMRERIEMARLFTDPKADAAALSAKQKELSAVRQRLMDRRTQAAIEWRSLLTPQQIQKLDLLATLHHRVGPMGHGEDHMGRMGHEMGVPAAA